MQRWVKALDQSLDKKNLGFKKKLNHDNDGKDDDDENDGLGSHDLPAGTDRRHLFNSSTHNTRTH